MLYNGIRMDIHVQCIKRTGLLYTFMSDIDRIQKKKSICILVIFNWRCLQIYNGSHDVIYLLKIKRQCPPNLAHVEKGIGIFCDIIAKRLSDCFVNNWNSVC